MYPNAPIMGVLKLTNVPYGWLLKYSIYEYCTVQSMEKATEVILNIIKIFAEK